MLRSIIEIHNSDGSVVTVKDEFPVELQQPCDITFPKIKEEVKWEPEELEAFASSYPCVINGWNETLQSQSSCESRVDKSLDANLNVIDLTEEEPICNVEIKPQDLKTVAENEAASACASRSKICRNVQCSEKKGSTNIEKNVPSKKISQEKRRSSSGKCKSTEKKKDYSNEKRLGSVERCGSKKRIVAQAVVPPKKKSCSCVHEKTCALHIDRKKHFCDLCGAMFLWKQYLDLHMVSHAEEMPYSCLMCSSKFRLEESLTKHMRFHLGHNSPSKVEVNSKSPSEMPNTQLDFGAPFGCVICNVKFLWRDQLHNHLVAHPDRKLFFCAICGSKFSMEDELFVHVETHTEKKQHTCTVCNLVLDSQQHLDNHTSSHTQKHSGSLCCTSLTSSELPGNHFMLSPSENIQCLHSPPKHVPSSPKPVVCIRTPVINSSSEGNGAAIRIEPDLRLHTTHGVTVYKNFFISQHKRNENSDSTISVNTSPPAIQTSEMENNNADQLSEVQCLKEMYRCHLCSASFYKKHILDNHFKICHTKNSVQRN